MLRIANRSCLDDTYSFFQYTYIFCFSTLRNGVTVDVYWNICSFMVLKLWLEDLLYAIYAWEDEKQLLIIFTIFSDCNFFLC